MDLIHVLIGIFTLANTFIALFIVVYAFLFLKKTKSHKDRRPWDYLFLASMIYLIYTFFLMFLNIYGVTYIFQDFGIYELSVLFQFIYTGLILLSFISQTDLIFNNEIIIIMKKNQDSPLQVQTKTETIVVGAKKAETPAAAANEPGLKKLEEKVTGKQLDQIDAAAKQDASVNTSQKPELPSSTKPKSRNKKQQTKK